MNCEFLLHSGLLRNTHQYLIRILEFCIAHTTNDRKYVLDTSILISHLCDDYGSRETSSASLHRRM